MPVYTSRPSLLERAKAVYARHETIRYLTSGSLKAGNRDKVLGHFWSLLDPMCFVGVYFVVFGLFFGQAKGGRTTEFLTYLVIGVIAWRFFDATVGQCANCIRSRRGLIHEINFPKSIFPVSVCLSRLYDFLWGLLVILVVVILTGSWFSLAVLWLPLLVLLQVLFTLGVGFVVAFLGAFFADTTNVISVGMRLWFYMSPVFYYATGPNARIPEPYQKYYMLNPMACFFEAYRDSMLYARMPDLGHLAYIAIGSVTVLLVGFAVFTRWEGDFAKYV